MELGTAQSLEQLDELCAEDTCKEALGRLLAGGAVIWNTWQKSFAAVRLRYPETDSEAAGPVDMAFATWSQSVWCEVSESVLGPSSRDLLKVGKKVPRLPQSGAPELDQGTGALGATTRPMLPPTSKVGGAPAAPGSWRQGLRGLLERGSRALRDSDAASAPGEIQNGYRGPPPAEFSIATPRATRAKTTELLCRCCTWSMRLALREVRAGK